MLTPRVKGANYFDLSSALYFTLGHMISYILPQNMLYNIEKYIPNSHYFE